MVLYLLSRELHHIEHILIAVEIEHITNVDISFWKRGTKSQWCSKRDLSTCNIKLHTMDEVYKIRRTEIGIARVYLMGRHTYLL